MIENHDPNNAYYAQAPRIYAFEVSYKGVLLYSKLLSLMWPNPGNVARKASECHAQSMAGCSDADLRRDFQTTGQGQVAKGGFNASGSMMRSMQRGRGSVDRGSP